MKRKLVTVLMTAIIGSNMLFAQTAMAADTTAQTEDTAKADETSEANTEELKTIGEKPEKETEGVLDVKLKNLTGKVVTGFAVKNEKDEKYPENFLKEDDKFAADEERELWFDTNKKDETADTEKTDETKAKENALFVSFFPQILQGPIGRYSRLANQLYAPHKFEGKNIARGFERILWGFFKKMILADWAAVFVDEIFANPDQYSGLALIGILLYTLQLYADFSGGMDVVIGIASMFGIELDENFKRPFFAVSVTDFWHRWHITLGTWMKDYVFYPVTLSRWMGSFSKWAKKVFGRKTGRTLPICIANIVVFFVVGVWHGAAWKFIIYGLYNGLIIAFSGLMAGNYRSWKKKLHISGKETWYYVFTVVRTFIITVISMYFDRPDNMGVALHMMKLSVTRFNPSQILLIPAGKQGTAFTPYALLILAVGCVILFVVSVLQERGMKIRESLAKLPLPVTAAVYFCLLISIGFFGSTAVARGFIYAQF